MKILIIGFIAFFGWSALSTYLYVCKIRGLCNETVGLQVAPVSQKEVIVADTVPKPAVRELAIVSEKLVVNFAFDKSEFKSDTQTSRYFDESKAYLDQNLQSRLSITGHTDAAGSDKYNQALGYRRAQSAQRYFVSKGMAADKIIIESKGEKEPADDNKTSSGRANNRRTVITINK